MSDNQMWRHQAVKPGYSGIAEAFDRAEAMIAAKDAEIERLRAALVWMREYIEASPELAGRPRYAALGKIEESLK